MVGWLALSLLSVLFYGLSNAIDKQIVGRHVRDHRVCIFIAVCFGLVYGILIAFFTGFTFSISKYSLAAILSGFLAVGGGIAWYFSIGKERVSAVSAIASSSPLYTLLLAVLFLGESPTSVQVMGMALLISGSVIVSLKKDDKTGHEQLKRALLSAFFMAFLWGASSVFVKYSLAGLDFWNYVVVRQIGNLLAILPVGFLLLSEKNLPKSLAKGRTLLLFGASETAAFVGLILFVLAASLGPISLVSAVGSIAPLLTLFWIFLLGRNHIAVNELGRENLKPILTGALLIMGGIYLIS